MEVPARFLDPRQLLELICIEMAALLGETGAPITHSISFFNKRKLSTHDAERWSQTDVQDGLCVPHHICARALSCASSDLGLATAYFKKSLEEMAGTPKSSEVGIVVFQRHVTMTIVGRALLTSTALARRTRWSSTEPVSIGMTRQAQ